jgi:hypothetical protein
MNAVDTHHDVTADDSGVVDIDNTALQLLVVSAIQIRNNVRRINRISPSKGLMTTANQGGQAAQPGAEAS